MSEEMTESKSQLGQTRLAEAISGSGRYTM